MEEAKPLGDSPLEFYVLVAGFHLKEGAVLLHAAPERPSYLTDETAQRVAELMLPEGSHSRDRDGTYFRLNAPDGGKLYCVSCVVTRRGDDYERGAVARALAVCARVPWVDFCLPLAMRALSWSLDRDKGVDGGKEVCGELLRTLQGLDLSAAVSRPCAVQRQVMRGSVELQARSVGSVRGSGTVVGGSLRRRVRWPPGSASGVEGVEVVTLSIPLGEEGDMALSGSVSELVRLLDGASLMRLYNAALLERRVMIVSRSKSAWQVGRLVLGLARMVSPPLPGVLERCYPYVSLADLGFLETKGFMAGATNPIFLDREQWCDVLCDVDAGTVRDVSERGAEARLEEVERAAAEALERGLLLEGVEGEDEVFDDGVMAGPEEEEAAAEAVEDAKRRESLEEDDEDDEEEGEEGHEMGMSTSVMATKVGARPEGSKGRARGDSGFVAENPLAVRDDTAKEDVEEKVSWLTLDMAQAEGMKSALNWGETWLRADCEKYTRTILRLIEWAAAKYTGSKVGSRYVRAVLRGSAPRLALLIRTKTFRDLVAQRKQDLIDLRRLFPSSTLLQEYRFLPPSGSPVSIRFNHTSEKRRIQSVIGKAHKGVLAAVAMRRGAHAPLRPQSLLSALSKLSSMVQDPAGPLILASYFPEAIGGVAPLAAATLHRAPAVRAHAVRILRALESEPAPYVSSSVSNLNYLLLIGFHRAQAAPELAAVPIEE